MNEYMYVVIFLFSYPRGDIEQDDCLILLWSTEKLLLNEKKKKILFTHMLYKIAVVHEENAKYKKILVCFNLFNIFIYFFTVSFQLI